MLRFIFFFGLLFTFCPIAICQTGRGGELETEVSSQFKNVYALVVGISDYKNVVSLNYADNDADLMTKVIEKNFPQSKNKIVKLINKEASELAIKNCLWQINKNVTSGDLVIFYFAGHGDVANINGSDKGYFLAHDASSSRDYEAGGAIRFNDVHDSIVKITNKGAKVYMITDACRSGKIIDAKGASLTLAAFNTGYLSTTKFISCQANELSYEYDTLAHGAFTYFLAKSISGAADNIDQDSILSVIELNNYLFATVRPFTNKLQTPMVQSANQVSEIFSCDPNVTSYYSLPGDNGDLALNRGSGDIPKSPTLVRFEDALSTNDLNGKSTSAQFIFENAQKTKSVSVDELELMKMKLAEAYLENAQETMNRFLNGKPNVERTGNFEKAEQELRKAAELLGRYHPMFNTILNRAAFFQAMEIVRTNNPVDFGKAESILIGLEKSEPKATYVHQGLAMLYVAKNNKVEALVQFQKVQKEITSWDKPKNSEAQLYILSGQLEQSLKNLQAAENLSSDKSDVYLLRSQMQLANFQLLDAQQELNRIDANSPASNGIEKTLILGKIEELRGRLRAAEKTYKDQLKTDDTNVTLLLKLADLYRSEKDTLRAKEFYTKALVFEPGNVQAKNSLTALNKGEIANTALNYFDIEQVLAHLSTLEKSKKNNEALIVINKALEINNWSPEYYFQKGKFLYNLNRKTESNEALKKGIELSPYHFESIRASVYILIEQKKFVEADALIKSHDRYFPKSAKWLTFQYTAYRFMNSKNDLFVLLEKAIQLDSFDLEPYRELMLLHIEYNGFKNAEREFNVLMELGGNENDENVFIGNVDKQVRTQFKKRVYIPLTDGIKYLLRENPQDMDYIYMGAMIAYMRKEYDEANNYMRSLQKFSQTMSPATLLEFYNLKGKINLETGNFEEAEMAFKMYNTKSTKPSFLGLAMAQFELGKKDEWVVNFKKDRDTVDFNEDAYQRFQKMLKKAGQ